MNVFKECENEFEYVQGIRRHIHQNPEIGFDVNKTAALVARELRSFGVSVRTDVGQTGVVGDLEPVGEGSSAKKCIALRADMDALPIQEMNTCSYRSQVDGKAHMCGHDAHTAMLLGAAKILSKNKSKLKNRIRFVFQPNEEGYPGGAPAMIKDGVLDGVDEIYGMHVWPIIPVKHFGLVAGPAMGRPDTFRINIEGLGGHASFPSQTIDPIVIGASIVSALQSIVSRNISFDEKAVLSVTQFHAGSTHNVIPESAFIEGTVRTFDDQLSGKIQLRMKDILLGFEKSYGAKIYFEYQSGYPVLINHEQSVSYTQSCLKQLFPDKEISSYLARPSLGGEDFAYYLQCIPGCYAFLGCSNSAKNITRYCHDPHFDIDEECMVYGMALHCQWALSK